MTLGCFMLSLKKALPGPSPSSGREPFSTHYEIIISIRRQGYEPKTKLPLREFVSRLLFKQQVSGQK